MDSQPRSDRRSWPYLRRGPYVSSLKQSAAAWFEVHHCEVQPWRPYCLANRKDWPLNIIMPEVASYIEDVRRTRQIAGRPFPLHRYLYDGLSSQALLFNLVGPLILNGDFDAVRQSLRVKGVALPESTSAVLEYEDRSLFNEYSGQPTSIDLVLGHPERPGAVFVEAKLVETGFGGCSVYRRGDCEGANPARDLSGCYLHHIGRNYWSLLRKHGFLQSPMLSERTCLLAAHYQFFLEALVAIEKEGYLVLVTDQRSPTFHCTGPYGERGLVPFLMQFVPDPLRQRVREVSIQEIVSGIERIPGNTWIGEFKAKYGL